MKNSLPLIEFQPETKLKKMKNFRRWEKRKKEQMWGKNVNEKFSSNMQFPSRGFYSAKNFRKEIQTTFRLIYICQLQN